MWTAAVISTLAVVAGALLALSGAGARAMVPLRSFALAAVIATVIAHLLPEALAGGGRAVLLLFAAAVAAPGVLARLTARRGDHDMHRRDDPAALAVELAYASLLLHKVTDGVALGTALGPSHLGHGHWDVVLAVAGHTVPMAATVALTYRARGARTAWVRTLGLAAAMTAGAAVADLAVRTGAAAVAPWLNAMAAGLLLHVVVHDLPRPGARGAGARVVELVAIAIGVALPLLGGADGHGDGHILADLGDAFAALAVPAAPLLVAGLLAAALLEGMALPGLDGAAPGRGLGAETSALTLHFLGWPTTLLRLAAVGIVAAVVRVAARRRGHAHAHSHSHSHEHGDHDHAGHVEPAAGPVAVLDELVEHNGAWLLAGAVIAAYVVALVAPGEPAALSTAGAVAVAAPIAIAAAVSASATTPVAAVLIGLGFPAAPAIAALVAGPAVRAAAARGRPALVAGLAVAIGVTAGAYALVAAGAVPLTLIYARFPAPGGGVLGLVGLALLLAIAARTIWRSGLSSWVAALHGHHEDHH